MLPAVWTIEVNFKPPINAAFVKNMATIQLT